MIELPFRRRAEWELHQLYQLKGRVIVFRTGTAVY